MENVALARAPHALVVEDDWLVRETLADVLEDAGFAVDKAASAVEALEDLARDSTVALVVTDAEMPGALDGIALARRIGQSRPATRVLVVAGDGRCKQALGPDIGFLAKPFTPTELLQSIGKVLNGARKERVL